MRETEAAAQAFADYVALGKERKLEALALHYEGIAEKGEKVPTKSLSTLLHWSQAHNWQARVDDFVRKQNELVLKRIQSDMAGERVRLLNINTKAIESIKVQVEHGTPVDIKQLTDLVKQRMQLLGEPLADKHEHKHSGDADADPIRLLAARSLDELIEGARDGQLEEEVEEGSDGED